MKQLLFFHATWCPPCRRAEKEVIGPLEQEVGPEKIRRINAQEAPQTAEKYRVTKLPTAIVEEDGEILCRAVGNLDRDTLKRWLE